MDEDRRYVEIMERARRERLEENRRMRAAMEKRDRRLQQCCAIAAFSVIAMIWMMCEAMAPGHDIGAAIVCILCMLGVARYIPND